MQTYYSVWHEDLKKKNVFRLLVGGGGHTPPFDVCCFERSWRHTSIRLLFLLPFIKTSNIILIYALQFWLSILLSLKYRNYNLKLKTNCKIVKIVLYVCTPSCSLLGLISSLLLYMYFYMKYEMTRIVKRLLILSTKFSLSQRLVCLLWDKWSLTSLIGIDRWLIMT